MREFVPSYGHCGMALLLEKAQPRLPAGVYSSKPSRRESSLLMNDNRLLVELIQNWVEQRLTRYKRFGVHLIGGLALFYLMIYGASQGQVTERTAIVIALSVFLSLLLHGMWLGLQEARIALTRQEVARLQQLYPDLDGLSLEVEKPKRDDFALAEDDADEPLDLDRLVGEDEHRLTG